jgi:hypothetical protein
VGVGLPNKARLAAFGSKASRLGAPGTRGDTQQEGKMYTLNQLTIIGFTGNEAHIQ